MNSRIIWQREVKVGAVLAGVIVARVVNDEEGDQRMVVTCEADPTDKNKVVLYDRSLTRDVEDAQSFVRHMDVALGDREDF